MKRKLYDIGSGFICLVAGMMMLGLMLWYVYEANDLSTALIMGGAVLSMALREAYHQNWPVRRRRR